MLKLNEKIVHYSDACAFELFELMTNETYSTKKYNRRKNNNTTPLTLFEYAAIIFNLIYIYVPRSTGRTRMKLIMYTEMHTHTTHSIRLHEINKHELLNTCSPINSFAQFTRRPNWHRHCLTIAIDILLEMLRLLLNSSLLAVGSFLPIHCYCAVASVWLCVCDFFYILSLSGSLVRSLLALFAIATCLWCVLCANVWRCDIRLERMCMYVRTRAWKRERVCADLSNIGIA